MARPNRTRIVRVPKQENETHILSNPLDEHDKTGSTAPLINTSPPLKRTENLTSYDYQAPKTAESLRKDSRWLIVRRNLHHIRYMGLKDKEKQHGGSPNFYLGLQMIRELKRAQEDIKNADKQDDFQIIKQFSLAGNTGLKKKFDISHVKPEDALIYDRLGEEPLIIQNLLYYFSKQDVQHGTVFWDFLHEVNQVLNIKRKRTVLVQRLRRLALTLAVVFYSLIGIMFFLMFISVLTTATKMNDPEVKWLDQNIEEHTTKRLLSI